MFPHVVYFKYYKAFSRLTTVWYFLQKIHANYEMAESGLHPCVYVASNPNHAQVSLATHVSICRAGKWAGHQRREFCFYCRENVVLIR